MQERQDILLVEGSEQDAQQIEQAFRKSQIRNPIKRVQDAESAREYLSGSGAGKPLPIFVLVGSVGEQELREFIGWVREQSSLSKLPVVLLQPSHGGDDRLDAQGIGATAVFPKRLDFKNLGALVKAAGGFWMLQTNGPRPEAGNALRSPEE